VIKSSIIIPLFNEINTIERLILSLEDQSMRSDEYQVIAVDDCSTDGTREYLRSLDFKGNFLLIEQDKNRGLSAGRNRGIEASDGDILIFVDGDMDVGHDWVESHTLPILNGEWDGSVGAVTHGAAERTMFIKYLDRSDRGAKKNPNDPVRYKNFQFWNTSIKKEIFASAGNFDDNIAIWGGEDTEMALRIEQLIHPILRYNPNAKAVHHQQRSLGDTCNLMEKFGANVVPYLIKKHPMLADEFKIDIFENFFVKKALMLTIFNPIFFWMMKKTYKVAPRPVAFNIIKYLLSYSVLKGYRSRPEIMDHNQND